MSNDFYNHNDGVPPTLSRGASTTIRSEFDQVGAGFDKMPTVAQLWGQSQNYGVAGGSVDAWTASIAPTYLTTYADGLAVRLKFTNANTIATPTLNVNALGAKTIVSESGSALQAGDIKAGSIVSLIYNLTSDRFQVFLGNNASGAAASAAAAAASASAASTSAGTATTQAGTATTAATAAATAQTAAETARDQALATNRIFSSAAAGDAGTSAGQYYWVVSASNSLLYELWLHNGAGGTDTGKRASSAAIINAVSTAVASKLVDGNTWGWFENDTRYLTLDGSNKCSAWADKLGTGRTFVQATGANQPVRDATNGLLFDGVSKTMALTSALSIPTTVYIVLQDQATVLAGAVYAFDGLTANSMACIRESNGTGAAGRMHLWKGSYVPANGYSGGNENTQRPTLPYLMTLQFNGASSRFQINQKTAVVGDSGTFGSPAVGGMTIGSAGGGVASFWNGYIREIIVRSVVDDATTIAQIQAYLLAKHRKEIPLYLQAGQSNAVGQGPVASAPVAYQSAFANGMIYNWNTAHDFQTYTPGTNAQASAGQFGLENSMLRELYTRKGVVPWLVKYAVSNTALYPGAVTAGGPDWYPDTVSGQYATLVTTIQAAVAWLEPGIVAPVFKGFVWMQGEGDTTNVTWANAYYDNLVYFVRKVKAAMVAATGQTTMPVTVIGRIASTDGTGGAVASATVKAAQDRFGASFWLPTLNTDNYSKLGDNIHYDASANGLIRFGIECADILDRVT